MRFRVAWLDPERGCLIAEQLEEGNFAIGPCSRLGPILLRPLLSQPRALDETGKARTDVFVFHAVEKQDVTLVAVGDTVELVDAAG